ncbi:protein Dok-7-like isoform X2 [Syngnathoides biaculeatus]|uniref:protein Dok-7-like isoform X2 n=1 Tax=Syngnathoides biaculeatus TaxID=300417 RepID=UPI002ADD8DC7|nr:protein Dok-7-like isoform X2 [Syngnathoides biaculeatus]
MTDSVVVEGYARLKDGKKWKSRWIVLRKPSPVADCLVLLVFKDKSDKVDGNKERASVTLEEICGLESGRWCEGASSTLAILCLTQAVLLGFDNKETLQAWEVRLRYSLGEVHRFSVGILAGTKLESGPATLHLCNNLLALVRDAPPVVVGHWNLPDLRRYGPVPNGFVFEGGTRCGYWAGVFLLTSSESEQISFLFDCIVRGVSPTKGPFGLQPILPDPSSSQTNSEERLNHETRELEKRLSMLSSRDSTASSMYCASPGGDDRSISGSSDTSDTSQSDSSVSSRLAIWTESGSNPVDSNIVGTKVASVEKQLADQDCGNASRVQDPRQLLEIGRQSSLDSGIATGSHSSYSGSFSSYTGSLDINSGDDFGSVFSLPPHLAQDLSPCSCPKISGQEYKVPTSLRYLYDTPKSLVQDSSDFGTEPLKGGSEGHLETAASSHSRKTKGTPSSYSPGSSTTKTIVTICSVCGGLQGMTLNPASRATKPTLSGFGDETVFPLAPSDISHPAAQIVDNSLRRSDVGVAAPVHNSERTTEGSPLPKKRREKLASFLAEFFHYPRITKESNPNHYNLYEAMSPALHHKPSPALSTRAPITDVIYENCSKCRGSRCRPPPRGTPAKVRRHSRIFSVQTFLTGLHLKKIADQEGSAHEATLADGPNKEMNGQNLTSKDKSPSGREERRKADPAYEIMESRATERNSEVDEKSKYELMLSCGPQKLLQETEGAALAYPSEASLAERLRSDGVTYVNIPVSPTSKKELNYMELELQEPGTWGTAVPVPAQSKGKGSTKYAQIDITATETAYKVGTQHALGRQEGLHTLERRKKGTPH